MTPLRNDGVTIACPVCGLAFRPVGRQRVCSAACRQAVWRGRHGPAAEGLPSIPRRPSHASVIYACPNCDARYLGEQRCPDCGLFCRRVGSGGRCPHCDEPVAFSDLGAALQRL